MARRRACSAKSAARDSVTGRAEPRRPKEGCRFLPFSRISKFVFSFFVFRFSTARFIESFHGLLNRRSVFKSNFGLKLKD